MCYTRRKGKALDEFTVSLTAKQTVNALQNLPHTYAEYLCGSAVTKIYLDRDEYLRDLTDFATPPEGDRVALHEQQVRCHVEAVLDLLKTESFNCESAPLSFVIATRHGWCPRTKCYKLSSRPFIQGVAIRYTDIPTVIGAAGQGDFWDLNVYTEREQLICAINGTKGIGSDVRLLCPQAGSGDPLLYVVQHVEPGWPLVSLAALSSNAQACAVPPHHSHQAAAECPRSKSSVTCRTETQGAPDDVQTLLNILSKTRWDNRRDWRDIATALKNEAGEKYKVDWLRLSQISSKFDRHEAEKLWNTVATGGFDGPKLRLGSIHKMAMKDDPFRYSEYRMARIHPSVMSNWDKEDRGLADITYHLLSGTVKRVGRKGDIYFFDESECCWCLGNESSIHRMVSMALEESLRDLEMYFAAQGRTESDETKRHDWDMKKKQVCERIKYVRKRAGMCNVTSVAAPLFQDDCFDLLLDSHRHLLGVLNGVVDLRSGELRERRADDMIFTVLKVPYNPEADVTLFHSVMFDVMAGDEEMVAFMQKLLGYGITGEVIEAVLAVFTASGRNGKGLITQTLRKLLGPFYKEMLTGVIVQRQVANLDAERGKLLGSRIAVFNELEPGDKLKMSEVQLLTGGDGIPATPKFRDPLTIEPRHLCILTTNYMPQLSEVKVAIVRRMLCIEFPVTFTDLAPGEAPTPTRRQCQPNLPSRLEQNLDGVLAWLVRGAMTWYADTDKGISLHRSAPAKVTEFSRRYFESQDTMAVFLSEECEIGEGAEFREASKDLRSAFNTWMKDRDARATQISSTDFVAKMDQKGYVNKVRRVRGHPMPSFEGVRLKSTLHLPLLD